MNSNLPLSEEVICFMSLPYNRKLIFRAKELRMQATRQENHLWYDFLRTYPIRFQRQKVIGPFIADFYCHKAKLIVELDGSQHYTKAGASYDMERDRFLSEKGLLILRISNLDVDSHFNSVCCLIDQEVRKRTF